MITIKDNVLSRPWEEKRFYNHRRKVQSALPVIDNKPPKLRQHVSIKLKKNQIENERIKKIERDNFILLRQLNQISKKCRVDHFWQKPPPLVINRVPLFETIVPTFDDDELFESQILEELTPPSSRKSRCVACTGRKTETPKIPEERVPWEPERKSFRRQRSHSVPVTKLEHLPVIVATEVVEKQKKTKPKTASHRTKSCTTSKTDKKREKNEHFRDLCSPQSIILSRGCLKLAVNFPSDTLVKYNDGITETLLAGALCNCKITEVF